MKEYDTLINVPKIPADGNFDDFVNDPIEFKVFLSSFFVYLFVTYFVFVLDKSFRRSLS